MNQFENCRKIVIIQYILVNNGRNTIPLSGSALFQGMDKWQSNFPLLQVMSDAFSKLCLAGNIIKRIVHKLEGNAKFHAEIAQGILLRSGSLAKNCPGLAGS